LINAVILSVFLNYKPHPRNVQSVSIHWNRHLKPLVTIHGALHPAAGHPDDNFTVSGIQPLAEGDLEWAGCVTVCGRLGREL
jgi:hypothetical protein